MKVMTIGGATQDIFIKYENKELLRLWTKQGEQSFLILQEGGKIEVEELAYYTGGGATNSASSFSRLGANVSITTKVGTDNQGTFIQEQLKKEQINITHISQSKQTPTGISIIIPSMTKEATVLAFRGANKELQKQDINEQAIIKQDLLYISSLSGASSHLLPYITQIAKKQNILVAVNPGISQLAAGAEAIKAALANIDIFILNSYEANNFMETLIKTDTNLQTAPTTKQKPEKTDGPDLIQSPITYHDICFSIHQFFKEMLTRGPRTVVVTNGAEGVYVAHGNQIYFHPSMPTDIVSTLGAGDAFGSCFTANISSGKSIEEAMVQGIINSASVISHLDAKTGLLSHAELEARIKKTTLKQIQTFPLSS